jgi:hypothetical protein
MVVMGLGSAIASPSRMQLRNLAVFAAWADDGALDRFLVESTLGRALACGWHVRLELLRRWGSVAGFDDFGVSGSQLGADDPVVAVTLARLKIPEVPRFVRWGRPVEVLVRDHPATTLALAAIRPPRTVSTFSVWRSQREMVEMVHGKSPIPSPARHSDAMRERERRDFHHEFTTLRFRALSEAGQWQGHGNFVPASSPCIPPRSAVG